MTRIPISSYAIVEYIRNKNISVTKANAILNEWVKDGCVDIDQILFPVEEYAAALQEKL